MSMSKEYFIDMVKGNLYEILEQYIPVDIVFSDDDKKTALENFLERLASDDNIYKGLKNIANKECIYVNQDCQLHLQMSNDLEDILSSVLNDASGKDYYNWDDFEEIVFKIVKEKVKSEANEKIEFDQNYNSYKGNFKSIMQVESASQMGWLWHIKHNINFVGSMQRTIENKELTAEQKTKQVISCFKSYITVDDLKAAFEIELNCFYLDATDYKLKHDDETQLLNKLINESFSVFDDGKSKTYVADISDSLIEDIVLQAMKEEIQLLNKETSKKSKKQKQPDTPRHHFLNANGRQSFKVNSNGITLVTNVILYN